MGAANDRGLIYFKSRARRVVSLSEETADRIPLMSETPNLELPLRAAETRLTMLLTRLWVDKPNAIPVSAISLYGRCWPFNAIRECPLVQRSRDRNGSIAPCRPTAVNGSLPEAIGPSASPNDN